MKIEHIAYWVEDLESVRHFYQSYFGAIAGDRYENPKNGFSSYFMQFDEGCRLEIMNMPGIQKKSDLRGYNMGLAHFAVAVGGKNEVDQLTNRLRSDGYQIFSEPRMTGDGYYESVVLDTEGNYVEITCDSLD
ncbi:MAG: VOC family protein [Cyclobacteriaceae bacterium]|nr:VOC family protein [Cyclobacteriaceae bacterium HetDA_MAG_MS6]